MFCSEKKIKQKFTLYRYNLKDFYSFTNVKDCLFRNSMIKLCDFSTIDEFNSICENLLGNYVFVRNTDNKVFLYTKKNMYKPFKRINFGRGYNSDCTVFSMPLVKQETQYKVRCIISKQNKIIEIIDEFGKVINGLMPEVVNSVKRLDCDSVMLEGRIGYKGPDDLMKKKEGMFFVSVCDVIYYNGVDLSNESYPVRMKKISNCIMNSGFLVLPELKIIKNIDDMSEGSYKEVNKKYDINLITK